jgi:hypothetical protein
MHNDILNWKEKLPILLKAHSHTVWQMFIEKLLKQSKLEMLEWFRVSVIGYDDSKARMMVEAKKLEIEKDL